MRFCLDGMLPAIDWSWKGPGDITLVIGLSFVRNRIFLPDTRVASILHPAEVPGNSMRCAGNPNAGLELAVRR